MLITFKQVRDAGLQVTVHAGEAAGAPESMWQAINDLGATRIGHGVKALEDQKADGLLTRQIKLALSHVLPLTLQTSTIADIKAHPIKAFLEHGVLVQRLIQTILLLKVLNYRMNMKLRHTKVRS